MLLLFFPVLKRFDSYFSTILFLYSEGRMHDARMLALSNLYDELEDFAFSPAGAEMCLYGDPAYPLRVHLQAPFRIAILTRAMQIFNDSMSAVRVSVYFGGNARESTRTARPAEVNNRHFKIEDAMSI